MDANHLATAGIIRRFAAGATLCAKLCAIVLGFSLLTLGQGRTGAALKIEEVKFDEFEDLMTDDVLAHLDRFAAELSKDQNLRGVIAGYRRNDSRPGAFFRELYGYQNYLVTSRGIDPERLRVIDGGVKSTSTAYRTTQLWLVSNWAKDPVLPAALTRVNAPKQFDSVSLGSGCVGEFTLTLERPADALRFFAVALKANPEAKGFVLVHPSNREPLSKATKLAERSRQLLIEKHGLESDRIFARVEARRTCAEVELWLSPANLVIPRSASIAAFFNSQLMTEAEQNGYSVRRVELLGNTYTRDNVIRRRLLQNEGDIFQRSLLEQSLNSLSKLRNFSPVSIEDVEVQLNREDKLIDFLINLTERTTPGKPRAH